MISLKQLHYALTLQQTLHFKKAAELCFVSQSALSTAISALEKQLGLVMFERDNKKVLVTPVGQVVLQRARQVLLHVDDLMQLADSYKTPLSFPMTIGVIPTIAPFLLPKMFPLLNGHYPQAQLRVIEDQSQVLVEQVRAGEMDAAILALPYPCEGLLTLEFWQEDFYWVSPRGGLQPDKISSRDIDQSKLLLLKEGHCLKDHILEACQFSEPQTRHNFAAASLTTLIQMVQCQLGTTLIPAMAKDQLISGHSQLVALHLDEPSPHRRIAFILRPNYTCLSSIEALIGICRRGLASG